MWHSSFFLIHLISNSVKKENKGVDLLASLCNNYDTSEDEIKIRMEEANSLIAEILKKKPRLASECKSENLENINTGSFENFLRLKGVSIIRLFSVIF